MRALSSEPLPRKRWTSLVALTATKVANKDNIVENRNSPPNVVGMSILPKLHAPTTMFAIGRNQMGWMALAIDRGHWPTFKLVSVLMASRPGPINHPDRRSQPHKDPIRDGAGYRPA